MDPKNAPRGREKHVSGQGKGVYKRGEGLGSGPVGSSDGYSGRKESGSGSGPRRSSGGGMKLSLPVIVIAIIMFLMRGGLGGMMGGSDTSTQTQTSYGTGGTGSYGSFYDNSYSSSSSSSQSGQSSYQTGTWSSGTSGNTGELDTQVVSGAREKYTQIAGNGSDTVTIMVYMCGTDLESRSGMATADLQEMASASIGSNVNLLVYTGGCKSWRNNIISSSVNQVYQVRDGGLALLVRDDGKKPMTDPATLSAYIKWCAKNFPANRNMLIFWDHGGGSVSGYGYDEKYASRGAMSLAGINTALKEAGVKFDFVGYDCCLMGTAENALMLDKYADYMIASEETEPGIGWYYKDWLTQLSKNTSMPTVEIGKSIIDGFTAACAAKCRGQGTTLSMVDLAEFSATVPDKMTKFAQSISTMLKNKEYQTVSSARNGAREFAASTRIDQVDLVNLAENMGNSEGKELAKAIRGAVKYNRTSTRMTNAYGVSIYFPYKRTSYVDSAVRTYNEIGMDSSYSNCIREFASMEVSGQVSTGGSYNSPLGSLLGGGMSSMDQDAISQLLGSFLGGDMSMLEGLSGFSSSSSDFLSFGRSVMPQDELVQYLADNHLDTSKLSWTKDGDRYLLTLSEDDWKLVNSLDLNAFYDDGKGYIDLGLDNIYQFDDDGNLVADTEGTWIAINGQAVPYYHQDTVDDGETYAITGRVPVLVNGERAELILVFDSETPGGYVAGVNYQYMNGETDTVSKNLDTLSDGDEIDFLCDYYTYEGDYQDSYKMGDPLTVDGELTISDVILDKDKFCLTYRLTDIYNQEYWTESITQ